MRIMVYCLLWVMQDLQKKLGGKLGNFEKFLLWFL